MSDNNNWGDILKGEIFESLFENSSIGMALVDVEGRWLKVNQAICDMVGYTETELLNIDFQTITHPEDLDNDLNYLSLVFKNEINSYEIEKRYFRKDGKVIWVRLKVSTVRDKNHLPKVYISQIEDITTLKEREEQLNYLIDLGSDGFWDWYLQEDYEYMSPRFWELLGYHAHEKRHHPSEWQKLIFKEDLELALSNFEKHVESKGIYPFTQEVRYTHRNGSIIHVICKGKVVEWDKDGKPLRMIGTHTDITAQKLALLKLQKEKNLHYQTARMISIGNLAGDIAHEINNPLTIISGNTKVIQKEVAKEEQNIKKVEHSIEAISNATRRVSEVMRELIKVTGSARNKDFEEIEINELIDNVFFLCKNSLINHGINVMRECDLQGLALNTHRASLVQVFLNIIHLFKRNLKEADDTHEKWINIGLESENDFLIIHFAAPLEHGYKDILETLNCPMQAEGTTDKSQNIELSMTKNIVQEHGGSISSESDDGITEIMVSLPLKQKKALSA